MTRITCLEEVQEFLNSDDFGQELPNLRKDELLLVSQYLQLDISSSVTKADICSKIKQRIEEGARSGDNENDNKSVLQLQLEIKKLELEEKIQLMEWLMPCQDNNSFFVSPFLLYRIRWWWCKCCVTELQDCSAGVQGGMTDWRESFSG